MGWVKKVKPNYHECKPPRLHSRFMEFLYYDIDVIQTLPDRYAKGSVWRCRCGMTWIYTGANWEADIPDSDREEARRSWLRRRGGDA